MHRYIALLRGINVGGNKKVPMAQLKQMMAKMGFDNVKTLLTSGNVIFDASEGDQLTLKKKLEAKIQSTFGFPVGVIIRTFDDIQALVKANPFRNVAIADNTRLYVTFLSEKSKSRLKIPYESPQKDFHIVAATPTEVCSILTLNPGQRTPEAMSFLEKEFGKNVTMRNWNTVEKLARGV